MICGNPYDKTSVPPYAAGISHRMQVRYRIENISPVPTGTGIIERVTKRSGIAVKVSKSSVTALLDKLEFVNHLILLKSSLPS